MRLFVVVATIAAAACSTTDPLPVRTIDVPGSNELRRDPAIQPYRYSNGIDDPVTLVIRDAGAWEETWARIVARIGPPKPPAPAVDFSKEMVLLVAMGTRPSGGYTAQILRAASGPGGIVVDWVATSPGANCFTTAALTQPIDIVLVPRADGDVRFSRQDQTKNC